MGVKFDSRAEVLRQVQAAGDLARLRCTHPRAFGIETLAVSVDDRDTRMTTQPSGSGRRGAIGQHVHDFARP